MYKNINQKKYEKKPVDLSDIVQKKITNIGRYEWNVFARDGTGREEADNFKVVLCRVHADTPELAIRKAAAITQRRKSRLILHSRDYSYDIKRGVIKIYD